MMQAEEDGINWVLNNQTLLHTYKKTKTSQFITNWEMEVNSNRLPSPYKYKNIDN